MDRFIENVEKETECFMEVLTKESVFPMQNPDIIKSNVKTALQSGRSVNFGCFVCMPIDIEVADNSPKYFVGDWKTRLERSKNISRFKQLGDNLTRNGMPFTLNLTIADTDIYDVYGPWLRNFDQTRSISDFSQKIGGLFNFLKNINITLWSDFQASFENQYSTDFSNVQNNILNYVSREYISRSLSKRNEYFKSRGLKVTEEIEKISLETAIKNIAMYAAQGPIIKTVFDCLIIADPDPLRMGQIQSLLTPDLGIIYPIKE